MEETRKDIVEFDYDKIMREDVVINCKNQCEAIQLLEWADSIGLKWNSGFSYLQYTNWHELQEEICYCIFKGGYDDLDYCKEKGYQILSYNQVLKDKS